MQEISCSICAKSADSAIVEGITFTVCSYCGNIHVAETDQYIRFDVSSADGLALVTRRLYVMALAMRAIYQVWDEVYREVKKKFN